MVDFKLERWIYGELGAVYGEFFLQGYQYAGFGNMIDHVAGVGRMVCKQRVPAPVEGSGTVVLTWQKFA